MSMESAPAADAARDDGARRRLFTRIALFFLFCAVGWGVFHLIVSRDRESTDNAYAAGNQIRVSARVSGNVKDIYVDNNQVVAAGMALARLDDTDARISLERSRANLAYAVRMTASLLAESGRLTAVVALRRSELKKVEGDLLRRRRQRTALSVSEEELQHAKDNYANASMALQEAVEALEVNRRRVQEGPLEEQPQVRLAASDMRAAWLELMRCEVRSPAAGVVVKRAAQVGMRVGQKAVATTDLYGASAAFAGRVSGFSPGTGSSFSLLPPENATGNWIKVVQRVPVKIALSPEDLARRPLLLGLSCTVDVDVSDDAGAMLGASASGEAQTAPLFSTDSLEYDMDVIDGEIAHIIAAHAGSSQAE